MIKRFSWEKWNGSFEANEQKDTEEYKDGYEKREGGGLNILPMGPLKISPQGMISHQEEVISEDDFDLWILYVNFDITDDIVQLIERIPGVETLEVLTRYRLRIGFPKSNDNGILFLVEDTKKTIEKIVLGYFTFSQDELLETFTNQDLINKSKEFRNYLLDKEEYWALYILPNGGMEIVLSNSGGDEFERKIRFLAQVRELVGGIILLSDDREL